VSLVRVFILLTLLGYLSLSVKAENSNRVLRYFAADQHTYLFITDVLKLAIKKNPELNGIKTKNLSYVENNEGRTLALLDRDIIDIFWVGTSKQREFEYEPVRFPIIKGLLGYRIFLTHKDNLVNFKNLTEQQLKSMVACQGISWPDTEILSANDYTVATASKFMQLIKLTNLKRCDYFPRAVYEGLNEIKWLEDKYPNLRLVDNVLLSYQYPIYFFVRKSDYYLARQIEKGLYLATSDGSYQNLFNKHESLKYLHPLNKWKNTTIFKLSNPTLPDATPREEKYWLKLY